MKRGQFYLVSTIILTAIIISIIAVSNYSNKNEFLDMRSLKDELNIEGARVLDYGINNELNQEQMNQNLMDFTQRYLNTETRDKNLYFIFGNQENITVRGYQKEAHEVALDGEQVTASAGAFLASSDPGANSVVMTIDGNAYAFNLKGGENFFFVISRQVGEEYYVITS